MHRSPLGLLLLFPALAGCELAVGGKPETCGRYPSSGGPAVVTTKDEELCDVVRLRVLRALEGTGRLTQDDLDHLVARTTAWETKPTLAALLQEVRSDAGDELAEQVARTVEAVLASSKRPLEPESAANERCLVRGVAKGVRIALLYSRPAPERKATIEPQ